MTKFYGVIIGSEILDGRREDKHFKFLQTELQKRGWELSGIFVIKDNVDLMKRTFSMLKKIDYSVIFSFGGIGATPDDFTRKIASEVFTAGEMEFNLEFRNRIVERFGRDGSVHRVNMSYLPKGAELLYNNPINGMNGFYLEKRFFFVPGFPEMAQPMIIEALDKFYPNNKKHKFTYSIKIDCSENELIDWMNSISDEVELSSLPKIQKLDNEKLKPTVDIKLESYNKKLLEYEKDRLLSRINKLKVNILDESNIE
jgi:molybdopterin-biosynthesis enzyme MoeA-like protein